jgi:glycosyltransferase involved in cell wall biosynthesis
VKKIIVVCQPFYPEATATAQLMTSLLESLSDRGVEFTVLCGFPVGGRAQFAGLMRNETYRGIQIRRCGLNIDLKRGMLFRTISYACFLAHVLFKLLWMRRGDVVFGVTNPPFNAQVLWLASCLRRFPYQYMIHDLTREALIGLGRLKPTALIARAWRFANGLAYRRAQRMIVLGRDVAPLLNREYRVATNRCVYIPNWSSIESERPVPLHDSHLYRTLGLHGKFIVQYSGNMGLLHDMESFVRSAELLRDDERIHFLFVGNGQRRAAAEQLSRSLQLSNITWLDFVPLEQLADSLACCHVALISLRENMAGVAVPSKLYGILASGRAILAQVPRDSEIALAVVGHDCGVVVPPGEIVQLGYVIRQWADDPSDLERFGRNAFQAYRNCYTLAQATDSFARLWQLQT